MSNKQRFLIESKVPTIGLKRLAQALRVFNEFHTLLDDPNNFDRLNSTDQRFVESLDRVNRRLKRAYNMAAEEASR